MSESQQLFDLVVTGHTSDTPVEALVREILTLLDDHSPQLEFKLSDALLFSNGMASIRDSIRYEEADAIRQQLLLLDVACDIRPTLQIVAKEEEVESTSNANLYTCPACGHQQPKVKASDGRLDTCEACGVIGERHQKKQRLQQVMDSEIQKHENERTKRIREVLERAKQEEEAMLREEARQRLGLADKPDKIGIKIAAVVAALGISFGVVYYLNQPTAEEIAQQEADATKAAEEAEKKKTEALGKVSAAAMEKVTAMSEQLQNMGTPGAAGPSGDIDAAINGGSGDVGAEDKEPATPEQKQQQREQNQAKLTEAVKTDAKAPATPTEAKEKQVKTQASAAALTELETGQLTPPRFQITPDEYADSRHRIRQYLRLNEADLTESVLELTKEAYPRTLLLLDIAEWYLQNQKPDKTQKYLDRIYQELAQTQDIAQQALILGCISKSHMIQDQWEEAGKSLQQATEKARSLPESPAQIELLTRLASEQALFGNQIAAAQVLEQTSKLANKLPQGPEPRSTSYVQIASSYAMLTDFNAANKFLPKVEDPAKRQKLAELIDKLQHRVEQMRAEYQQTAATGTP